MEYWNIGSFLHLFAAMLNKLGSLTYWAYIGACLLDPRFSIQYIGRSTKRAVMGGDMPLGQGTIPAEVRRKSGAYVPQPEDSTQSSKNICTK
jgi:hypothetical protein